jgi:hypothetical protein
VSAGVEAPGEATWHRTVPPTARPDARARPFRFFSVALMVLLGGYMFFGRSFSYLHVPGTPLFVGEIVLAIGLVELVPAARVLRALVRDSLPLKLLAGFMAVCAAVLALNLGRFGMDAVRDSSIWYYGLFSFLVATALAADPGLLPRMLAAYRRVLPWFLVWAPLAVFLSGVAALNSVYLPDSEVEINSFKPTDIAVHVGVATAFLWLRLDRVALERPPRSAGGLALPILGILGLLTVGSQGRGGFIGGLLVCAIALLALSTGERRVTVSSTAAICALLVGVALLVNFRVQMNSREFSVGQIVENMASVVGKDPTPGSDPGALQGTVSWRMGYWQAILADTLNREDHLLVGQGFGVILAEKYGIEDPNDPEPQPLRSAHNSHLTILGKAGAPAAALWVGVWLAWFAGLARWWRLRRNARWGALARVAVWVAAAAVGWLFDAIWDPAIESPSVGIWVYCLFGVGAFLGVQLRRGEATPLPATADGLPVRAAAQLDDR